ncbi:NDR1/HIN1-like protein 13 [Capsicum chacoense]
MEERSPTAGGKARNLLSSATSLRLSLTPARSPDHTYVVQIPRDQVYRVPPPENAKIVEYHRQPATQKKRKCTCCCWVLSALLLIGIIIGIIVLVIHTMYAPKCPQFSITSVHFKNATQPSNGQKNKNHPQSHPQFEIELKIFNVNEKMDVVFGKGNNGKATLIFKKNEIAQGKYPSISQNPKDSTNSHFNLDAGKLTGDIQKSLDDDKKPIPMTLSINAPLEITSWAKNLKKDLSVTCDFDVESVKSKSKVKSEDCHTNF